MAVARAACCSGARRSSAHRELKDTEQAFIWLGDAIVSHVDDEPLAALERLADEVGEPRRAEVVLSRALEEVFDGPLVRKLLARRAAVRREKLADPPGAAADLKRLHDLSPADTAVMDQLSLLYVELEDYRGMVQLYEDQILRGKEPAARAELARNVARLWQEKLDDPREAADAWRRVLRMKAGDAEAVAGLERPKPTCSSAPPTCLPRRSTNRLRQRRRCRRRRHPPSPSKLRQSPLILPKPRRPRLKRAAAEPADASEATPAAVAGAAAEPADASEAAPAEVASQRRAEVAPAEVATAAAAELRPPLRSRRAEVAPAEVAPAEVAPTEAAPAEVAPAEVAPTETAPAFATPTKAATAEDASAELAQPEPSPVEAPAWSAVSATAGKPAAEASPAEPAASEAADNDAAAPEGAVASGSRGRIVPSWVALS